MTIVGQYFNIFFCFLVTMLICSCEIPGITINNPSVTINAPLQVPSVTPTPTVVANQSPTPSGTPSVTNECNYLFGNIYGLPVAPETLVYLTGSTGTKPSKTFYADTSMKLRVKVTAQSAANNTVNSNWINPYGCFRVIVTVNGITMQTQILRVDGLTDSNCTNAPTSEILDFTQYMTGNGTPLTITFSNAEYDNCRYTDPFAYGGPQCGMKPLYQTHQAKFKAAIQVDGQYMDSESNSSACNSNICTQSGMFSSQTDCQTSSAGSTCTMTTSQSNSGSVVCWVPVQNQTTTAGGVTGTALCSPEYTETVSPSSCSSTQTVQTFTRNCKAGCTCSFGSIQTFTQNCTADIYGDIHYSADCTGGVQIINGYKFCAFSGNSCPAGFNPFMSGGISYTTTTKMGGYNLVSCSYTPQVKTWTNEHSVFSAIPVETISICTERNCGSTDTCKAHQILTATVNKILCY